MLCTKTIKFLLLFLVACGDRSPRVQPASAQPVGPNGLPFVTTLDGGLCSGKGTSVDPLTCSIAVDNLSVTGTGSAGNPLAATVDFDGGYFCDGSDGAVTFDGSSVVLGLTPSGNVYTMTRDICCSGCTIDVGVTIQGGWRFFDNGILTLNGKIARNGSNGGNGTTGGGGGGNGAVGVSSYLLAAQNGGNGGVAGAGAAGGSCNGAGEVCVNTGGGAGVAGGTCKGGGGGGATTAGGAGGAVNVTAGRVSGIKTILGGGFDGLVLKNSTSLINCGSGGGGGGGSTGAGGGGGGGGGGYTIVSAKKIVGSGSIEAKGGNGGNGSTGGNTGGGGGGGGGIVTVLIGFGSFPTVTVTGGTGGAGNGTGVSGGNGGDGYPIFLRMGS